MTKHLVDSVSKDIEDWILNFLSKPNEVFNGLPPCPYAKKAWVDGKVVVQHLDNRFDIKQWISAELENYTYQWPKGKEVVVLGFDPLSILPHQLSEILEHAKPMLSKRGYTALEDHPFEREEVAGVHLNQGTWALVLLQPTEKLVEARAWLESKDYYKNWDPDYKQEVINR